MADMLNERFSLEDLSITNNAKLLATNREKAREARESLKRLADCIWAIEKANGVRYDVHSAFRCSELNGATPGSSKKSQHMLGQAMDLSGAGPDTEESVRKTFQQILGFLKVSGMPFGQLILESAQRDYGRVFWIHFSLGAPYRELARCGQVMSMKDGKYTLIEVVKQKEA